MRGTPLAATLLLALVASGCAARNEELSATSGPKRYGSTAASAAPDDPDVRLGPQGGGGPTVRIPGRSTGASGSGASGPGVDDFARLGRNARLYLSSEAPKLIVEVDAVQGYEPSAGALSTLRARLDSVADKPAGIEVLPVETFPGGRSSWTENDVMDIQRRQRDRWSSRDEIVLYVLYVDGSFAEDERSLGVSFNSSMYAIFIEQIRDAAATPLVSAETIERAVAVHEMGHVLALVNIGYRSPRNHEDPNHPGHSSNGDSVMYWAVDNVGVASLVGGRTGPPTQFDDDDLADLEDLKSGRLRVE
jgi:hypothetical protein